MTVDIQNFLDLLVSVNNNKRTGKLHAYTSLDGRLTVGTLFFNDGQLIDCQFNNETGGSAVAELIDSQLASSVFIRSDGSDFVRRSSMPDIDELLSKVGQIQNTESLFQSEEFIEVAVKALNPIYGERTIKKIKDIAKDYPPPQNPRAFADECVKLASNVVGDAVAGEMMRPLYRF